MKDNQRNELDLNKINYAAIMGWQQEYLPENIGAEEESKKYFENKTELMLQKPIRRKGIGWPVSKLYDVNGCFVGAMIPQAEGLPLMQSVLGEEQLKLNFPRWNKKDLCELTICILEHIIFLQDRHIIFGFINTQSIYVKDKNQV